MCELAPLIGRYLDGECSRAERRRAEEHLLACPECAADQRRHLQLSALLRMTGEIKAPRELADMVMTQLRSERRALGKFDHWIERRSRTEIASLATGLSALFAVGAAAVKVFAAQPAVSRFLITLELGVAHIFKTIEAPFGRVIGL